MHTEIELVMEMSHISYVRTELKNVNKEAIKKTVELLQKYGENIVYFPNKNRAQDTFTTIVSDFGIIKWNGHYIGFKKSTNGKINVTCDLYFFKRDDIQKIVDTYLSVIVAEALKLKGYSIEEYNPTKQGITIVAVGGGY